MLVEEEEGVTVGHPCQDPDPNPIPRGRNPVLRLNLIQIRIRIPRGLRLIQSRVRMGIRPVMFKVIMVAKTKTRVIVIVIVMVEVAVVVGVGVETRLDPVVLVLEPG